MNVALDFSSMNLADESSNLLCPYHLSVPGPDKCDYELASLGHHRCHQCCCHGPSDHAARQGWPQTSSSCEQRWYVYLDISAPVIISRTKPSHQECSFVSSS
jgi:hypothetical protein